MKIILLTLAFCALITTSKGQSAFLENKNTNKNVADAMDDKKDIVSNIATCNLAKTFFKAIKDSGLTETFNNPGPITLFLPTDSAFKKMPPGKLDTLLMLENKYNLISLLTYHALPGNVKVKDIARDIRRGKGKTSLHTVAGAWLTAEFNANGDITLTDERGRKSTLYLSNIKQQNGMLHLVSDVLIPTFQSI